MTFPPIYFFAQLFRIVRTGSGSCVLLSLCSLLLSQQVTAGINQWTTNGPLSKPFTPTTFVIDPLTPTTLYAGTSFQGIFKSDNGGASWTPHNTDSFTRPDALVIDPLTPSTLYAVASDDVFKSIDGGGSWTAVNTGFPELPEFPHPPAIFTLVIHPLTPTTLYAVSFFPFLGLFKTTDSGQNWTPITNPPRLTFPPLLALDPQTPSIIYVGIEGSVFRSEDGGSSWAFTRVLPNVSSQTRSDPEY